MLYIEHTPAPPLDRFVRKLWYACLPGIDHRRERVLPTGCTQLVISLARDFLLECPEGRPPQHGPAAQIVGARSTYELIDTSDLAGIIGVVFHPGGFPAFVRDSAHVFANRFVDLEDLWGAAARSLRAQLRELATAKSRLLCLESFLANRVASGPPRIVSTHDAVIRFAVSRFTQDLGIASVRVVARATGFSERRFSQLFREQVGLSPKVWCRIQRFQRAVHQLRSGADIPWPELALDCGFYDQSHFANEFRAFSGISPTTYTASRASRWPNHVPSD